MSRPIHFEIHAAEPGRAIAFYTALFGWQFSKWDGPMPYWLITTGPDSERGINGGLVLRKGDAPAAMAAVTAFVCTVDTADLDASLVKVAALGGIVVVPKMPIPGVGWLAYAKDTEGNLFGMLQPDATAKPSDCVAA